MSESFVPFSRSVTRQFRDQILDRYPALASGPNATVYREIAQYVLFGRFRPTENDWEDDNRLVFPAAAVAIMAKRPVDGHGFSAARLLEGFDRDVWPLGLSAHRYTEGRARTVCSDVPSDLQDAFFADQQLDWDWKTGHRVWFTSGRALTRNTHHHARLTYQNQLLSVAARTPDDHPAHPLMDYLNNQPSGVLGRLLRLNWPAVTAQFHALPDQTMRDRHRRAHAARVMMAIRDSEKLVYGAGQQTARIFALGLTINQLPREMRQAALSGAVHFDVRACQLAVASSLWHLPKMRRFLAERPVQSIWRELMSHIGVGEEQKETLKVALYAIVFGAKVSTVSRILRHGNSRVAGLGAAIDINRFFVHRLIAELLGQRDHQLKKIKAEGYVVDAFDRMVTQGSRHARSLLAQQIQSWEMRLMLALLPVIKADSRLVLLNHLHDGFSLYSSRPGDDARGLSKRVCSTFDQAASHLGIDTYLEMSQ